jgi:hypothetical protein
MKPGGPVAIRREGGRGAVPTATALDMAAVLADPPFGPGRFWFVTGQRCEMYEVPGWKADDAR